MILNEKTLEEFGYEFEDVKVYSPIYCLCDYCGVEFTREKRSILAGNKHIKKDACKKCTPIKRNEVQEFLYGKDYKSINSKKVQVAVLEKYGCNPNQLLEVKEKIKKTCLRKYGVTSYLKTKEIQEQKKQTSLKKYGTEHPAQSDIIKEKTKQTNNKKYGADYLPETKEWKDEIKNKCNEKYGVDNVMQTNTAKENLKAANLKKYGVEYALQNPQSLQKLKKTCLNRYGKENYSQTTEYREKYKKTCLEKFGVEYPLQNRNIFLKALQTRIDKYGKAWGLCGKTQQDIQTWLGTNGYTFSSDCFILQGKEIDLYNEKLKFGIEFCGLFWHNECSPQPRLRSYHYDKYKKCADKKIRLITIFEDEWRERNTQCKDFLLSSLGNFQSKIMARKCIVSVISSKECASFCNEHHIQGAAIFKKCFGLFYNKELIGILGLSCHHRQNNKNEIVLNRICFKSRLQIIGGSSKMFSACVKWCMENNYNKIITWSDNRWSNGNLYEKMGFKLDAELPPDYSYVNTKKHIRVSKQSCKKSKIKCPVNVTEKKWLLNNGFARIWDCGKKRWAYLPERRKT